MHKADHKLLYSAGIMNEYSTILTASYEFLTFTETTLHLLVPITKRFGIRGSRVRDIRLENVICLENTKLHRLSLATY